MDLPGLDDLKASGLLDLRPAIEALPEAPDLFDDTAYEENGTQEETGAGLFNGANDDTPELCEREIPLDQEEM